MQICHGNEDCQAWQGRNDANAAASAFKRPDPPADRTLRIGSTDIFVELSG